MLPDKLKEIKQEVDSFLKNFFAEKKKGIGAVHPEVRKMIEEIEDVTLRGGDRFRPFMVWLGANIRMNPRESKIDRNLLKVMCSTELLQTFALIHDDIIDKAEMRRGGPTIKPDEKALLAGDLCFVFADELLNGMPSAVKEIYDNLREEVIAGEWLDVYFTNSKLKTQNSKLKNILNVIYEYKTARYSFLRPFEMGMAFVGVDLLVDPHADRPGGLSLQKILIDIGLAFQMKDDYLDLFGDERLGKKIGGDLKEGKLTVFHAKLMEKHVPQKYLKIFGNPHLTDEDVEWVKKEMRELGMLREVEKEMRKISERAIREIRTIGGINEKAKKLLMEMAEFVVKREF